MGKMCIRDRVSFYRQFRRRRTPIAGTDFVLDQGRIDIVAGAQFSDTSSILRIFSLMATYGYALSQAAEDRITDALPALAINIPEGPYLWNALREVLLGPHAAHALRTMHALGVLEMLIPEFHGIDALVIRDSYHRYTVDEHTFLTIDTVSYTHLQRRLFFLRSLGLLLGIRIAHHDSLGIGLLLQVKRYLVQTGLGFVVHPRRARLVLGEADRTHRLGMRHRSHIRSLSLIHICAAAPAHGWPANPRPICPMNRKVRDRR